MSARETTRVRSKLLFGNAYMLEVCAAMADVTDRVNLAGLMQGTDLTSASLYSGPIRRLVGLGLLTDAPESDDNHRERWYRPADCGLWLASREQEQ